MLNSKMLTTVSEELGFNDFLLLSRGESNELGKARAYILANTFEAFLGALFLDANQIKIDDNSCLFKNYFNVGPGFQYCQLFIENISLFLLLRLYNRRFRSLRDI
jgi:hypothetical protein